MSKNFTATRPGKTIAVGTSNAATQLDADLNMAASASDVLIDNRGPADAYVLFGSSQAAATAATAVRIPAGSIAIYGKGSATHIATIAGAATTLTVHLGEGL